MKVKHSTFDYFDILIYKMTKAILARDLAWQINRVGSDHVTDHVQGQLAYAKIYRESSPLD